MTREQESAARCVSECACATCATHRADVSFYFASHLDTPVYQGHFGPTALVTDAHVYAKFCKELG